MTIEFLRILILALVGVPLAAALVVAALGRQRRAAARGLCLAVTLVCLAAAGVLAAHFAALTPLGGDWHTFRPEFVPGANELRPYATTWDLLTLGPSGAVQFYLGMDGINVWLIVLTAVLVVSSVLVSWNAIEERANEFYAWLLVLAGGMFGVFLAFDVLLFYVFFELTLVPLFFLIGVWGGPERRHAARKFFIFTLAGSVITLLGLLGVVLVCYQRTNVLTFSIPRLVEIVQTRLALQDAGEREFWLGVQRWVFAAMMVGFAIKVPLFPVHTWLPLAHVEAPTAGSVLLAGVLLKIGTYGILRLCLPLAPDASLEYGLPVLGTLAVIGILYGAVCALAQEDVKKLVAYSSVSHLGFCVLGLFALNAAGLMGGLLQMINHGLSTGALFLLVGMLYERYHTRMMGDYGGMAARLKVLAVFMVFTCLSSLGLPGLNGFIGEALIFLGAFEANLALAVIGSAGIVLGAWYLLQMLWRVFFGAVKEPGHHGPPIRDLNGRELAALVPIAALCLILGLYPQPVIDVAARDVQVVARIAAQARQRAAEPLARNAAPRDEQPRHAGAAQGQTEVTR